MPTTTDLWVERIAEAAEVDPYKWMDEDLDEIREDDPVDEYRDQYFDMLDEEEFDCDYEDEGDYED